MKDFPSGNEPPRRYSDVARETHWPLEELTLARNLAAGLDQDDGGGWIRLEQPLTIPEIAARLGRGIEETRRIVEWDSPRQALPPVTRGYAAAKEYYG